jgi:tetratricopeptide (TPR) repeat protein
MSGPGGWREPRISTRAWDRSLAWLHQALAIYRAEQAVAGQAAALLWRGRALGDVTEAKRCLRESLELSRRLGDNVGVGVCQVFLGVAAARDGDLDEAAQLAGVLIDLAGQEASMGHGAEVLQALAESSRLDEQIGRRPRRSYQLAAAALAHLARDEPVLAISALGGHDAHPSEFAIAPFGRIGEHVDWLDHAVMAAMRARLDAGAVAVAAAVARAKPLDQLIDELIIQSAEDIT